MKNRIDIDGKLKDALHKIDFAGMASNKTVSKTITIKPCSDLTIDTIDNSCAILSNRTPIEHWDLSGDIPVREKSMDSEHPSFMRDGMKIIIDDKNKRVVTVSKDDKGEYILIFNGLTTDDGDTKLSEFYTFYKHLLPQSI